ncbi:MAG TPA: hypothetical protein VFD92_11725 [Candidatus Binatia bacterium]|nr:hypothetical protein [Candidatus Binatia bacterium]
MRRLRTRSSERGLLRSRGGARRGGARDFACIDPVVGERLALLSAGLVDGAEAKLLTAHVAACHACADDARVLDALVSAARSLPDEAAEPAVVAHDDGGGARRSATLLGRPSTIVAVAGFVAAIALVVGWQRARDGVLVAEIRALRAQIAQVEHETRMPVSAGGEPSDRQPVIPIANVRFPSPPNL